MQQDAEECWSELLSRMTTALQKPGEPKNPVDELFGFEMQAQDKCIETEEVVDRKEKVRVLKFHISKEVSRLNKRIQTGLEETIEKTSEQLGRSAEWTRTSKINSLPPFLNL